MILSNSQKKSCHPLELGQVLVRVELDHGGLNPEHEGVESNQL